MPALEELRQAADKAYIAIRTAPGETYGEVTRNYIKARQTYEEEARKQGVKPEIVIRDQRG